MILPVRASCSVHVHVEPWDVVDRQKSWKRDRAVGSSRWRIEPAGSAIGRAPREQKSPAGVRGPADSLDDAPADA